MPTLTSLVKTFDNAANRYMDFCTNAITGLAPISEMLLLILFILGLAEIAIVIFPFAVIGFVLHVTGVRKCKPTYQDDGTSMLDDYYE